MWAGREGATCTVYGASKVVSVLYCTLAMVGLFRERQRYAATAGIGKDVPSIGSERTLFKRRQTKLSF